MIKVCILDLNNENFEKISAVFNKAHNGCTVATSTNPVEILNGIFNNEAPHVLVFPKNIFLCPGLPLRSVLINLKRAKAPLVTLITNNTFNHLDLLAEIEQVNFVPEVPGINLAAQVLNHVEKLLKSTHGKATESRPGSSDTSKAFTMLMNSYMDAINGHMETYMNEKPERQNFYVKSESDPSGDISSIISVTSQYFEGSIAVSFKDKLFLQFASNFMKEKFTELNEDCRDIITEMITEVSENFMNQMKKQNININVSIPMVMIGKDHRIKHISNGKIICLKFALARSSFSLEFLFQAKA